MENTFRALRDHFGRHNRPNETTIGRLVRKFEETGSVGDLPKSFHSSKMPKSVRTIEILQIEETSQPETCQFGRERERERVIWRIILSLSNAVRVDKDRKTSHRLSLSLSPSFQTDVATYRAAYGLSPLSVISLWFAHRKISLP